MLCFRTWCSSAKRENLNKFPFFTHIARTSTLEHRYNSFGGTGPEATKDTIHELRDEIQNHTDILTADMNRVADAMEATRSICADVSTDGSCTTEELQGLINKYSPA